MTDSAVITNIDDRGVATVVLSRPEKHNAFDDAVIAALDHTFTSLADNDEVRVVVLASEGKSFSAGADLAWMQRMAGYSREENLADARALATMLKTLNNLPQPTIARVQGAAYGGAVGLVSCCDIAVGSAKARFCLSEVKIGLAPATISPYVIAAMGQRAARRYFTTAEVISAEEAKSLGLLSELVGVDELDTAVNAHIDILLANGPRAVREAKRLVLDYADQPIDDALIEDSCTRIAEIRVSDEGQSGLQAFLEKKPAAWSNTDV
jgi:methylglutaconyl-CoA hydratase